MATLICFIMSIFILIHLQWINVSPALWPMYKFSMRVQRRYWPRLSIKSIARHFLQGVIIPVSTDDYFRNFHPRCTVTRISFFNSMWSHIFRSGAIIDSLFYISLIAFLLQNNELNVLQLNLSWPELVHVVVGLPCFEIPFTIIPKFVGCYEYLMLQKVFFLH